MRFLSKSARAADASFLRGTPSRDASSSSFRARFVFSVGTAGFTLVELLISMSVMAFLLIVLSEVTGATSRAWKESQSRTDTFQSARTALEIVTRELTPAVVDARMQFVVAPGSILSNVGASNVAPESPAILWMAPLGSEGNLCCVGYYLTRDEARQFYRLKRIYIPPTVSTVASSTSSQSGTPSPYFPKMLNLSKPRDVALRTSPLNADWFTRNWDANAFNEEDPNNANAVVSSAADGVIAFWVQGLDVLGNPIPQVANSQIHPNSPLYFNSAAYFEMATSTPFENGASFVYLAQCAQSMKANRLPAAIDLTLVTVDAAIFTRGLKAPTQTNVLTAAGALDVAASVVAFQTQLQSNKIYNARVFTTRVKLTNGS